MLSPALAALGPHSTDGIAGDGGAMAPSSCSVNCQRHEQSHNETGETGQGDSVFVRGKKYHGPFSGDPALQSPALSIPIPSLAAVQQGSGVVMDLSRERGNDASRKYCLKRGPGEVGLVQKCDFRTDREREGFSSVITRAAVSQKDQGERGRDRVDSCHSRPFGRPLAAAEQFVQPTTRKPAAILAGGWLHFWLRLPTSPRAWRGTTRNSVRCVKTLRRLGAGIP